MKIGLLTDSLTDLPFGAMLEAAAGLKIDCLEFACGNWSTAPHVALAELLESEAARRNFLAAISDHGMSISALNCSGNPLYPGAEGARQREITQNTFRLARLLGVDQIVMMSGLPGGPGDANPNWITTTWPPECATILDHQWNNELIPYWRTLVKFAQEQGVRQICLELHGCQLVYNPFTLSKLRETLGPMIGANYDPSHPLWMGADPLAAVRSLGSAIYYVHAKDCRIEPIPTGIDGLPRHATFRRCRTTKLELCNAGVRPWRKLVAPVLRSSAHGGLRRRIVHRTRRFLAAASGRRSKVCRLVA